mmetsp:Transcript_2713/g.8097  ORF Transcript_2713/g.8097 Transcript_2713/m.8097 type:complete len:334 (+) Transcript_2713:92-1093(+)
MEEIATDETPKMLICGQHQAGKTSILKVILQRLPPHETRHLGPTPKLEITSVARNALVNFKVLDLPGSTNGLEDSTDSRLLLSKTGVVVFVINAQEPYLDAVTAAKKVIEFAYKVNPKIAFDIVIHKIDGDQFFSDERKTEITRDIQSKLSEEVHDKVDSQISFHCTTIYDVSVFEAFSKIIQKLIPQLPLIEQCLDLLITYSRMEKAYLFDALSKVYIATDPHPVDLQSYELCADMLDVVVDTSCIYGQSEDGLGDLSCISRDSKSVIHLENGTLLCLRGVDCGLAVICILREENYDRQHLIDYNFKVFQETLAELHSVAQQRPASFMAAGS